MVSTICTAHTDEKHIRNILFMNTEKITTSSNDHPLKNIKTAIYILKNHTHQNICSLHLISN